MATTAQDVIKRALRLIGAIDPQETPNATEVNDALTTLNDMIDAWNAKSLSIFEVQEFSGTWTANAATQTIGSGGDFNTTRPVQIESAYQRDSSNFDHPIQIYRDPRSYELGLQNKTFGSTYIQAIYYDKAFPLGTMYAWPVPTAAATVKLHLWQPLTALATTSTAFAFPPGYKNAFVYNLSVEIIPEYPDLKLSPVIAERAASYFKAIQQANVRPLSSQIEPAQITMLRGRPSYNTKSDEFR